MNMSKNTDRGRRRLKFQLASNPTGVAFPALGCSPSGTGAGQGTWFVNNQGGVLGNVRVQLIFWGTSWTIDPKPPVGDITDAVEKLLAGPYMSALNQYGVGRGAVRGVTYVNDSDPPAPSFTWENVGDFVIGLIDNGSLPEPDAEGAILHCVIMPSSATFASPTIVGENGTITWNDVDFLDIDNDPVYVMWIGNDGTLDYVTTVFSHELAEACTDPNSSNSGVVAGPGVPGCPAIGDCQIGDVCTGICDYVNGVKVQAYWSQRDNACVVPSSFWSAWTDRGAPGTGGLVLDYTNPPAVVYRTPDHADIFAESGGDLWQISWDKSWSPSWNSWSRVPDSTSFKLNSGPAAASYGPDKLDVYACSSDGHVWEKWWNGTTWSAWTDRGAPGAGVVGLVLDYTNPPAVVYRTPDHADIFAEAAGALWQISWDSSASPGWSSWSRVPDSTSFKLNSGPAAASYGPDKLDVYACGSDGQVWEKWWDGLTWSAWTDRGAPLGGLVLDYTTPPAVVYRTPDHADIFTNHVSNTLWQISWDRSTSPNWSTWSQVPDSTSFRLNSGPAAASYGSEELDVYACSPDGHVWEKWWDHKLF